MALVKEFYSNLYDPKDRSPKKCKLRGKLIKFDATTLNNFLETLVILEVGERYPEYSHYCHTYPDHQAIAAKLCIPRQGFMLNVEGAPWKLLRKDLTTLAQTWSVLSYSNLAPTSHTSDLNVNRAQLVYRLVMKMNMDVGAMISSQISQIAQSNSSKLGFSALIRTLCEARRSLTFESLSPTINMAYIRKNCWNPDDPSITFPGSRKARARAPTEAPQLLLPFPDHWHLPTLPLP